MVVQITVNIGFSFWPLENPVCKVLAKANPSALVAPGLKAVAMNKIGHLKKISGEKT